MTSHSLFCIGTGMRGCSWSVKYEKRCLVLRGWSHRGKELDLALLGWVSIRKPDYTQTDFLTPAGLDSVFHILFVFEVFG